MRSRLSLEAAAASLLLVALLSACGSPGGRNASAPAQPQPSDFSGTAAWRHLESLVAIGPRASGTPGSRQARSYLREALEEIGARVSEYTFDVELADPALGRVTPAVEVVSVVGVLPGESDDIFLLAAPYDTAQFDSFSFVGANGGASGPALLLEVARAISSRPRPYTVWIAFLDGDALSFADPDRIRFLGSEALSQRWAQDGVLDRIRLAVFFDRVADADLGIARDLWSHSMYRDLFWQAAHRLGHDAEFGLTRGFESPETGHRAFLDQRLRRVVALVDNRYGAGEPPGSYWRSEDDTLEHCSPESLTTVGRVALEAIDMIGQRLAKIDRFARSPF